MTPQRLWRQIKRWVLVLLLLSVAGICTGGQFFHDCLSGWTLIYFVAVSLIGVIAILKRY